MVFVALGAVFMASSIVVGRRLGHIVSANQLPRWRIVIVLMYCFLASYLLFIATLASAPSFPAHLADLLGGTIFLGGAVFVFLVMKISRRSIQNLREHEQQLQKAGKELVEQNVALEKEIAERLQAEKEVAQSRNEWESTFNTIDEGITVHDMNYRVILFNEAAKKILGPGLRDGVKCYWAYHGTPQPPDRCPSCAVLRTSSPIESEFFEPHLGRHLSLKAFPRKDKDGRMAGVVHVIRDVTTLKDAALEQEELQVQLAQSQKLETVGRLAGGVAHDFNNLITVIMNYSDVLARKLGGDHEARPYLKTISDTVEKAGNLTQQLLAFSRRQVLKIKALDLNGTVEEMLHLVRRTIGENVNLVLNAPEKEVRVMADKGQLEQILLNLVVNARDAMPLGGRLTVETGALTPDGDFLAAHAGMTPGDYGFLRVSDSGEGMTPEVQDKIFEPFFTTKTLGKGTGLGLATVYGIIKQHKGFIFAESSLGKGSVFTIFLPLATEKKADAEEEAEEALPGGRETILLVDDEELVRESTREVLESLGYRVITASSGENAAGLIEVMGEKIELLITDVVMEGMDGRELSTRTRDLLPGIRVLFISGYTDDILGNHGILDEGTEFMKKPMTPALLARKVRSILDGGKESS
jgi:signal transduction histidine kinase